MRYIYKTLAIFLTALSCSAQLEKIKTEKPTNSFTAPIQKVGTPLQSAQNPAPTVNQGLSQLKLQ